MPIKLPNKLPTTGDPIIDELYRSVRLLLRQSLSGSVPPTELMSQMQKLDKIFGKHWETAEPNKSGYFRRAPRKK